MHTMFDDNVDYTVIKKISVQKYIQLVKTHGPYVIVYCKGSEQQQKLNSTLHLFIIYVF